MTLQSEHPQTSIKITDLPELSTATKIALTNCQCFLFPQGFTYIEDLVTQWQQKRGRKGFLNIYGISIQMIDEIEYALKQNP